MTERIKFIDGLKGLCGIWVCVLHYILAFFPAGFVGWQCGIAESAQKTHYFENFPLSIVKNSSFALYIFFALIAFIPALKFFKTGEESGIRRQALKRYFRLMPPTLACVLLAYAVYSCGAMFNQELAESTGSHWNKAFYAAELSLSGAIRNGLFDAFIHGNSDYCSVLWCLNVIFFGSNISYAVLLMFGKLRLRWIVYAALFALCSLAPTYAVFIAGIAAADILVRRSKSAPRKFFGEALVIAGLIIGNIPPVLLTVPAIHLLSAVGVFLVIWGCAESRFLAKLLSANWLCFTGRISFSLILVHFTVLMSFSAWLFLALRGHGYGVALSTLISWGASIPVILAGSWLFEKIIEQPAEKLSNRIYQSIR